VTIDNSTKVPQNKNKMVQKDFIGDRLRAFVLSKHLSIKDFADFIGMDAGNVQKYLNGKRKPGTPLLQRLKSDGCNLDWLLTGEGEMYVVKEGAKRAREDAEPGAKAVSTQTEAETNAGAAQTGQKRESPAGCTPSAANPHAEPGQTQTQRTSQGTSHNNDQRTSQRTSHNNDQDTKERLSSNQYGLSSNQGTSQQNQPLNACSTPHQQPVNDRSTQQQQPLNANAAAQSIKTAPFFYEAIGRRLAVREESIEEGDILVIDPVIPAAEGDLILRSSTEGPEIVKYQPGEKNIKGVVVSLTRQYPAINRQ
jgi:transcriptional regulator with XRE-family HTH domain